MGDCCRYAGGDGDGGRLGLEAAAGQEARHRVVCLAWALELGDVAAVELEVPGGGQLAAHVPREPDRTSESWRPHTNSA